MSKIVCCGTGDISQQVAQELKTAGPGAIVVMVSDDHTGEPIPDVSGYSLVNLMNQPRRARAHDKFLPRPIGKQRRKKKYLTKL